MAEARRARRPRKLDQIEIAPDQLTLTGEVLGKGGYGTVYMADYNGRNAAAKVFLINREKEDLNEENQEFELEEEAKERTMQLKRTKQRKGFLRELEAMMRLRSPHTVNVYGAITSLPDRFVLVMELLPGGDLYAYLHKLRQDLPEHRMRQIVNDVSEGMAFLHRTTTVHGDLKSGNILLDGVGRAKVNSRAQIGGMSFCWSSPAIVKPCNSETGERDRHSKNSLCMDRGRPVLFIMAIRTYMHPELLTIRCQ